MAATFGPLLGRPLSGVLLPSLGAGAGLLLLAASLAPTLKNLPSVLLGGPPGPRLVLAALGLVLASGLFGATLGATWGREGVRAWGAAVGGLAALLVLLANGICVALLVLGAQRAASFALAARPVLAAGAFALIATPALLLRLTVGIVCAAALGHAGAPESQRQGSVSIPALFARSYLSLLRRPLRGAALGALAAIPSLVAWTMAIQALLRLSRGHLDSQALGATALAALTLALAARFSCALYQVALPLAPPQRP